MLSWKETALALHELLDNIDTLEDMSKSNDANFRKEARKHHLARHKYIDTDGYQCWRVGDTPPPPLDHGLCDARPPRKFNGGV